MNMVKWVRDEDGGWFASADDGKIELLVKAPNREHPFPQWRWSARAAEQGGGSGTARTAAAAKRYAEKELIRFREWLASKPR